MTAERFEPRNIYERLVLGRLPAAVRAIVGEEACWLPPFHGGLTEVGEWRWW